MRAARLLVVAVAVLATGCAPSLPEPAAAVMRTTPPPWPAPQDGISYIAAAGLSAQSLDYRPASRGTLSLRVSYGGATVAVPGRIGEDRLRARTAGLHTHDDTATVYLEPPDGAEADRPYTLGEFFTLWGVRLTAACLADRCDGVVVLVDGVRAQQPAPDVPLTGGSTVEVRAG